MMKAGLLGYPIGHSLSPAIHNAAYRELGLDWEYSLYPCADAAAFIQTVRAAQQQSGQWLGFNVTTPYKPDAFALADQHSCYDAIIGHSNVLLFSQGGSADGWGSGDDGGAGDDADGGGGDGAGDWCSEDGGGKRYSAERVDGLPVRGDNTDGRGLVAALRRQAGTTLDGARVILCGTGPVSFSVLLSLVEERVSMVTLLSRDAQAADRRLQEFLGRLGRLGQLGCLGQNGQGEQMGDMGDIAQLSVDLLDNGLSANGLPAIEPLSYDQLCSAVAAGQLPVADFLIDATPVGMAATQALLVPTELLHPKMTVVDVVYGHGETALAIAARQAGALAIDGLGMLVEQAALTIEVWAKARGLAIEAPREVMYQAAK
jgi:shikimate dehydrogenase